MSNSKRRNIVGIFLVSLCLAATSLQARAEATRAISVIVTDSITRQTSEVKLYNKSIAVIIGIDQYANLPADKQLSYAVHDAQGVSDILKRQYKFDKVITLYNKDATRASISRLLLVDLPKQLGEEDALFIFWAGHGNQEATREGDIGYLIPYDGDPANIATNITMSDIRDTVSKKIPAKHIFYVMDACYSGLLTETRSIDKAPRRDLAYLQDITKERVRQVLTAGSKNQEVLDGGNNGHSVFAGRLIELLEKTGDFITANEIQTIIKEKVNGDARARNHNQTPSFGTLYGSGDFVFIPSLEQRVLDSGAEIAKLEAELKQLDVAAAAAQLASNQAEADRKKREADIAKKAIEGKLKAQQLKQDELAAEQRRREAEEMERLHLIAAKSEDDKRLAELKAQAEARRKNNPIQLASDFPTLESAVAEIRRLNERINAIEAGYASELAQTRQKVKQRYDAQLAAEGQEQRDEFESAAEFKSRQDRQRAELIKQRDAELGRFNVNLSAGETKPLRDSIKALAEREYTLGAENLVAELGLYNAEARLFPVQVNSKTPGIKLALNGNILLSPDEAKAFKQQWLAGLVRLEAKLKPNNETVQIALLNDADNSRLNNYGGRFMSSEAITGEMITIPKSYYELGKYEVTQAQWYAVMGGKPGGFTSCGDSCPVEQVSWNDVQEFIQKLNVKTGKQYRLPSEAEWEYACYGGSQTGYCGGNDVDSVAWYSSNSNSITHLVGQKQANSYGLYDMTGNVGEWMSDCWGGNCTQRAVRGGAWSGGPQLVRAVNRSRYAVTFRSNSNGFRLARTLP